MVEINIILLNRFDELSVQTVELSLQRFRRLNGVFVLNFDHKIKSWGLRKDLPTLAVPRLSVKRCMRAALL